MSHVEQLCILGPSGSLGYGVNADSLERALADGLDVIGADAGSTDMGAYYLGSGKPYHSRQTMKRDLSLLLHAAADNDIPLLVGTSGGAGGDVHLEWTREIVREVCREEGLHFPVAAIRAEQDKQFVKQRFSEGRAQPMVGVPERTADDVDRCEHVVAQMGVEPYIEALEQGARVILAGRACDAAIFAAEPVRQGFDAGLALHLGKILECGAMSAIPPTGRDCMRGILRRDSFEVVPPNPERRVTPESLAAHSVYEVEHPYLHGLPTGVLDLHDVQFRAVNGRSTEVTGTKFLERPHPTLRVEGAELRGYRSAVLGGIRDPQLIGRIDDFIATCNAQTRELIDAGVDYEVDWTVYGRNGVMGALEPSHDVVAHELGVLVQVLAETQEAAHDVASLLEARMIGYSYPGTKTRTANVAFPMCPVVLDTGPVFRFTILHTIELDSTDELVSLFPIDYEEI